MNRPTLLMILDGFGYNPNKEGNAIAAANIPNINALLSAYPHTLLGTSGMDVGLPVGQMGNSEVGHLNIGAGRIVYQEFTRITKAIKDKDFFKNKVLVTTMEKVKNENKALHLFGLLSDGGVHSHNTHLYALLEMSKHLGLKKVYIHAFLDGRDVPPKSAIGYIKELEYNIKKIGIGEIASISGRYYAMDRDKRWERVSLAYDAIACGEGTKAQTAEEAVINSYNKNESDEFVTPTVIIKDGVPICTVSSNDAIIMFNFRPDRAREITRAFVDTEFDGFKKRDGHIPVSYVCMTQYDAEMPNVDVAFPPQTLENTLGQYISSLGLKQLRIAETEKYAHVTFFFNGGIEAPNVNEDRILIPSPKIATYDLKPEMSAFEVTDRLLQEINRDYYDLIIINYANADMVGHTGIMEAAIQAIEAVDTCIGRVYNAVKEKNGTLIITADHGNADSMLDDNGSTVTAHSLNKVPFILVSEESFELSEGILADVAPTVLDIMGLEIPEEMTGKSLIAKAPALAN